MSLFGFLAPTAFLAFAVLGAAMIATYLLKPRRQDRPVASTVLWQSVVNELQARHPWRRVPPSLLLLLQLLALAALVTALARPFVRSTTAVGANAIVLLDVSASMQAADVSPSRLDAARAQVAGMIDALGTDQTMTLLALGPQPEVLAARTSDHLALRAALASAQATNQPADLAAGLALAGSLAAGESDAQAWVIGDGSLDTSALATSPLPVRVVPVGSPAENLAITSFGSRLDGDKLSALASVANYGKQRHSVTVELTVDGAPRPSRAVTVDPGQSADAQWTDLPPNAQQLQAHIAEPDALAIDNTAWLLTSGERPTRVLLISEGNVFLEKALELRAGVNLVKAAPIGYAPITPANQAFDLTVLDGFMPQSVPATGSLLVLDPTPGNSLLNVGNEVAVPSIDVALPDSPILANVSLASAHVNRTRQLEAPGWADAVLVSNGSPLLLVGQRGVQRVAVLGFDVHQSDLPLQPAFPVLVQNLLNYLVPSGGVETPVVRIGDPITLVPLPDAQSVQVVSPDGQAAQVAPPFPPRVFGGTSQPGLYRVVQVDGSGQQVVSHFAVNFTDASQSRLAPGQASNQSPSILPGGLSVDVPPQEVWALAAALVLGLLGVEWWAYYRR